MTSRRKRYAQPPVYYKDTKTADVVINTPYGEIYGESYFNEDEDDPEMASEFVGCMLAEYRAAKELWRRRANALHNKYLGAKACVDACVGEPQPEAVITMRNFERQWKAARDQYRSLGRGEHDYIQSLVDEKRHWLEIRKSTDDVDKAKEQLTQAVSDYVKNMED